MARRRLCWLTAILALAIPAAASAAGGNIPEGLWVLNLSRSKPIAPPASQVLWIVKDTGKWMVWVAVATDAQRRVQIMSWDGPYDGAPVAVTGSGTTTQLTSTAPATVHNWGQIPGAGAYVEDCSVTEAGKRFVCHGKLATSQGPRDWLEDYDWAGPSPG